MKFITFDFQRSLAYPLFFSFIFYVKHYFNVSSTKIINGSIYSVLFYSIGLLFAIIPYFTSKTRTTIRHKNSVYKNMTHQVQGLTFPRAEQKYKTQDILSYTLIVFVCIASLMIQFIQTELINSQMWLISNSCLSMLGTYITVGLCYAIFKATIFRHKIIALGLLVIVSFVLGYFFVRTIVQLPGQDYIITFIILLMILEPLRGVAEKYLMEYYLINNFTIIILEGIVGIIISSLGLLLQFHINVDINFFDREQRPFLEGINWPEWIEIGGFIIFSFLLCHLRLASNEFFHPLQRYSFDSLPYFLISIGFAICCYIKHSGHYEEEMKTIFLYFGRISYWNDANPQLVLVTLILDIGLSFIWLFSAALLNEIIILKCCKLDDFTMKNIGDRGNKEADENRIEIQEFISEQEYQVM